MSRRKLKNVGETEEFELPIDEAPAGELPIDEAPADELPIDEAPIDEAPADELPTDEAPTDEAPTDEELENISVDEEERRLKRERSAFLKDVGRIGQAYGAGKTSMISLAERVTEAAMHGTITTADVEDVYNRFRREADARATIDDAGIVPDAANTENPAAVKDDVTSKAQQLSKLRTFIKLGNAYEDDALDVIRNARNIHLRMLAGDRSVLRKGSTYTLLVHVAREQLAPARNMIPLDVNEIEALLTIEVSEKAAPDGIKKIEDALTNARAAQRGGRERAPITNEHLDRAIEHLRSALGDLAPERLDAFDKKTAKTEDKEAIIEFKRLLA